MPLGRLLEDVAGLQMQYAPSGYVGLWTRLAGFARNDLTRALHERQVIQATLMRATIHVVSARDFWPLAGAIRASRREWLERVAPAEMGQVDMGRVADAARAELADGPLRQNELLDRLVRRGYTRPAARWVGMWIDLVRMPPLGTWEKRRADLYGLAETWIPPTRAWSEGEGIELVVWRYLGAYGPARPADIADWAGLPVARLGDALARTAKRRYRDEQGRELVDLADSPLPAEDSAAPVRFLPTWDDTLLVHARRTQILPEEHRPRIFNTRMPQSVGTVLVDGQVRATWRYERPRLLVEELIPLAATARREVDREAARLAEFHS